MNVLVVDDNVTYLDQMKKYLSLHSLQVQTAESGKKSLELMGKQEFDVVILDLKMPDISGIDVLEWAQKHDIYSKFIIITGYGRVDTAVKSMKLGAVDYLQKPFEPEILLKLIHKTSETPSQMKSVIEPFPRINSKQVIKKICKGKTILVVTGKHVADFLHTYSLKPACHIVLSLHNSLDSFDAKKIVELQNEIKKFIFTHRQPLIIHGGLSVLLEIHGSSKIQDYLMDLHEHILGTHSQLIMLYDSPQEKKFLENLENRAPSTFIDEVVKIFEHSTRCAILNLLARHTSLHYSDFLKKMDIEISSNLAFHLKRLTALKLIDKKDGRYTLTDRGKYFVGILFSLAMGKYSDPASNVIYCSFPES
jgi:ActR/RegA family two-component response regulator